MATDYLESKFPSYVLTEDTTVVPLKTYYRLTGGVHQRVLDAVATDNPKGKGWYQRVLNHNAEYRHNLMSHQVNNIANICHAMSHKMTQFPRFILPRTTTDGTITLDWTRNFFDTCWNEMIGCQPVPEYIVPFSLNLYFAKHLNELVYAVATKSGIDSKISQFKTEISRSTTTGKTYTECGYSFDPSTLGDPLRTDDLYTCVAFWEEIDFRRARLYLQNILPSVSAKTDLQTIMDKMDDCARTLVDIGQKLAGVKIVDGTEFTCTTMWVPVKFEFNGTEYFRLCFKNQLVNNRLYGQVFVNGSKDLEMFSMDEIQNPLAKFITLDLPDYDPSLYPKGEPILFNAIQSGQIWYTDVPFNGLTS